MDNTVKTVQFANISQDAGGAHKFISDLLTDFVKENPSTIVMFFVYLIVVILQDLVMPHFSGKLVSAIQHKQALVKPFLYILTIIITIQLLYTYTEWKDTLLVPEMQGYMRTRIVDFLLKTYSSNYAEVDIASVLMRAFKLPHTLFSFMDQMRYLIVPYFFVYSATIAYIAYHDVLLGALVALTIIIIYGTIFYSPKTCEKISQQSEFKSNIVAEEMEDIMNNLISVYSQNQQEYEKKRVQESHEDFVIDQRQTAMCVFKIKLALFPLMAVFIAAFIYRCYVLLKRNKLDTGKFIALFMIMTYVANSMWRMINQLRDIIPRWGRIRDGLTIFDVPKSNTCEAFEAFRATKNSTLVPPAPQITSGIYLQSVFFKYPEAERFILKNLTLHIPDKQKVAIVGRIGCGKSTLLKLIMKYYESSRGQVFWHGIPYSDITPEQMRSQVGYVHQYPNLFKRTVYENITYGLDVEIVTREAIMAILKHINMEAIFDNIPMHLDGNVGRRGSKLSGGQKQMVWLLRTFFKNPDILILDEPTASVDQETKEAIQKMLELVMINKTVIIVTHDKFLLDYVDRVITLELGQVAKDVAAPQKQMNMSPLSTGWNKENMAM